MTKLAENNPQGAANIADDRVLGTVIFIMRNKLKPVRCDNCKHFDEDINYKYEGVCNKDGEYTRSHRVCNKLPTDDDRRNVKLRRNG